MKKLFLLAMIVLGTSLAQAQDDSIKRFRFKASASSTNLDRNHLFSEDLDHCGGNLIDTTDVETFTYNSSTNQLSYNGNPLGAPVSRLRGLGLVNLFAATYNEVNVTSRFGTATRRLLLNADTNVWE